MGNLPCDSDSHPGATGPLGRLLSRYHRRLPLARCAAFHSRLLAGTQAQGPQVMDENPYRAPQPRYYRRMSTRQFALRSLLFLAAAWSFAPLASLGGVGMDFENAVGVGAIGTVLFFVWG